MLLLCDVIGNIQHLPTGRSNRQSHLQSALLPTIIQIFCMKFCMDDPHDLINHTHDEKKCLATVTTFFSKLSVFVTVSLIILFKFLFDVFPLA